MLNDGYFFFPYFLESCKNKNRKWYQASFIQAHKYFTIINANCEVVGWAAEDKFQGLEHLSI